MPGAETAKGVIAKAPLQMHTAAKT